MTEPPDTDAPAAPVLRVSVPSMAERLAQPGLGALPPGSGRSPARAPAIPTSEEKPVSVLKRLERYFSAFFKLGRIARMAKTASRATEMLEPRLDALTDEMHALAHERDAVAQRLDRLDDGFGQSAPKVEDAMARAIAVSARLDVLASSVDDHDQRINQALEPLVGEVEALRRAVDRLALDNAQSSRAYSELSRRLDLQRFRGAEQHRDAPPATPPAREGLDALLESFYGRLEDRFRGSREEIKARLAAAYLDDIRAAAERCPGRPVLDIGCGRGEWVELLVEAGIAVRGVDLNPVQIAEARGAGLPVEQGDALAALAEADQGAFAAVTAHHLVEHLPFETVAWLARETLRVLAPGGLLIVETPNARNLIVGATTFHIDPTHIRPLPAEVMTTLFDTIGYHPVELRPLHPSGTREGFLRDKRADPHIADLLFGPQDLAVLAHRPKTT